MGGLGSLSRAVPQWECGGWARLNDLLTNYILFLRFYVPGGSPMARSRFTSYLLLCSGMLFSTSTCVITFVPVGTATGLCPGLGCAWCCIVRKVLYL